MSLQTKLVHGPKMAERVQAINFIRSVNLVWKSSVSEFSLILAILSDRSFIPRARIERC